MEPNKRKPALFLSQLMQKHVVDVIGFSKKVNYSIIRNEDGQREFCKYWQIGGIFQKDAEKPDLTQVEEEFSNSFPNCFSNYLCSAEKSFSFSQVYSGLGELQKLNAKTVEDQHVYINGEEGKILVIDFWTTWSQDYKPPFSLCASDLMKFQKEWEGKVDFLSICCEEFSSEKLNNLTAKNPLPLIRYYTFRKDTPNNNFRNIKPLPFLLIIGSDDNIEFQGHPANANIADIINNLLRQKGLKKNQLDKDVVKKMVKFFSDPEFLKHIQAKPGGKYFKLKFKLDVSVGYDKDGKKAIYEARKPHLTISHHYSMAPFANFISQKIFSVFPKELFWYEVFVLEKGLKQKICLNFLKNTLPPIIKNYEDFYFIAASKYELWRIEEISKPYKSHSFFQNKNLKFDHMNECKNFNNLRKRFQHFTKKCVYKFMKDFNLDFEVPEDFDEIIFVSSSFIQKEIPADFNEASEQQFKECLKLLKSEEFQKMVIATKQKLIAEIYKLKYFDTSLNLVKIVAYLRFVFETYPEVAEQVFENVKKKIISIVPQKVVHFSDVKIT